MKATPNISALIEALDEPTLLAEKGRIVAANQAASNLFGRVVEGSDVRLAIRHPAALERIQAATRSDLEITGIGTAERPWLLSVRPLEQNLVLIRLIDRSAARAAEKMRVDFVANASHELRTPLTTISGYAETIADDELDADSRAGFAATIRTESKRMLRIIQDLMSLSRIEADRFVAPREEVSISDVAQTAAANARELAGQRGCCIELKPIDPGLPMVRGDFAQLLQMADNLVSNALRYGCANRDCRIEIGARAEGDAVVFSVRDHGEGISPEHMSRLTERFYRIDEARSRDSGGTGLGLAIVKHIVERHRGTLDIKSSRGRGTEVLVRLPADASAAGVTKLQ